MSTRASKKYYLCGPMSGYKSFNIPLFDHVAGVLRSRGLIIVSPAELDSPEYHDACMASNGKTYPPGETWGALLARDVRLVADVVDGILLLPDWTESRGARLEVFVGLLTRKEFGLIHAHTFAVEWVSSDFIRYLLGNNLP